MLIELPNGDWIDPTIVRAISVRVGDSNGPRVVLDLSSRISIMIIEFDMPEAAREWAKSVATQCNAATAEQPKTPA